MEETSLVVSISLLGRSDFDEARAVIEGFGWTSFDDYRSERDGLAIGLASAGQRSFLVPISIAHFMNWWGRRAARTGPDELEVFARLVFILRSGGTEAIRGVLRPDPRRRQDEDNIFETPVREDRYREWLAGLRLNPSQERLDAYARFIAEEWIEFAERPVQDDLGDCIR